jgi:hypothetical protein
MSIELAIIGWIFLTVVLSIVLGWVSLLSYMILRMMRNPGWDDSNITNALRILSHVVLHTEDFGKMYYPNGKRPFWYVDKDELSEVVKTRP